MEDINKIAVICGGSSPEREVSINSGNGVNVALLQLGFKSDLIDYRDIQDFNDLYDYELVFIALHGFEGENGELQARLDDMNIIFTGSKSSACRNTWNKNLCKKILNENSINTPNSILLNNLQNCSNDPFKSFRKKFGYKPNLFMKPCEDGSSIDIFKISNDEDYKKAKLNCLNLEREFIFEEQIGGREFTVTIIGNQCYPAIEIKTKNDFYDYDAKYISDDTILDQAKLSDNELNTINDIALRAFCALKCSGWARVDIIQDISGDFNVIEINTVPGMTSHSCVPKSGSFMGLSYQDVIKEILNNV